MVGRAGRHIDPRDAEAHIAGYTIASDVTAFDLMFPGHADDPNVMPAALLQQLRGKGHDTFLPLGPAIVTADEIRDPGELEIVTTVNGEERQRARAEEMLAGIPRLVAEASAVLALHPGDLILTGTPPGIGLQQDPPVFLRDGDVVEIAIDDRPAAQRGGGRRPGVVVSAGLACLRCRAVERLTEEGRWAWQCGAAAPSPAFAIVGVSTVWL